MKFKKKRCILIGIILGIVALILYLHRATIFGTAIAVLLFPFFFLIGGMNSPAEYKIVNEIGEPLSYDEVWNEAGIFTGIRKSSSPGQNEPALGKSIPI